MTLVSRLLKLNLCVVQQLHGSHPHSQHFYEPDCTLSWEKQNYIFLQNMLSRGSIQNNEPSIL